MIKRYKLPIQGTVLNDKPLTGSKDDPLVVFPIEKLPNSPTHYDTELKEQVKDSFRFSCLEYNLDEEWCEIELESSEEFHNWLAGILPQLNDIKKARSWKLDKSKLGKK